MRRVEHVGSDAAHVRWQVHRRHAGVARRSVATADIANSSSSTIPCNATSTSTATTAAPNAAANTTTRRVRIVLCTVWKDPLTAARDPPASWRMQQTVAG